MAYRLAGISTLDTGGAALLVLVRRWDDYSAVASVTPAGDGTWEAPGLVDAGPYDVTTRGPVGYQPVCHGPITAVLEEVL